MPTKYCQFITDLEEYYAGEQPCEHLARFRIRGLDLCAEHNDQIIEEHKAACANQPCRCSLLEER